MYELLTGVKYAIYFVVGTVLSFAAVAVGLWLLLAVVNVVTLLAVGSALCEWSLAASLALWVLIVVCCGFKVLCNN